MPFAYMAMLLSTSPGGQLPYASPLLLLLLLLFMGTVMSSLTNVACENGADCAIPLMRSLQTPSNNNKILNNHTTFSPDSPLNTPTGPPTHGSTPHSQGRRAGGDVSQCVGLACAAYLL